jgi:hypothetical protein
MQGLARVRKDPGQAVALVRAAMEGRLLVWDWNVPLADLPDDVAGQIRRWMGTE